MNMHYHSKYRINPEMKMIHLLEENHLLLLMLQHFEIDFRVGDSTIAQLCKEYDISENLFIRIANLYSGVRVANNTSFSKKDVLRVINFLKNSHTYYRSDKYPQVRNFIFQLKQNHPDKELKLLEQFFDEYFAEVLEHLNYEDTIAFPYFIALLENKENTAASTNYSSDEYSEHHTDIELKLKDLKSLLLKHLKINDDWMLRRQLLFALYELEYDLYIHSLIEETILIPAGIGIENE